MVEIMQYNLQSNAINLTKLNYSATITMHTGI